MKVLIVLEDPTHDRFIVKPIVERLPQELSIPARVEVLEDPHLRGIDDLIRQLDEIFEDNPMIDLFLVVVDNDCDRAGNAARLAGKLEGRPDAIGCVAIEEVEVWMLAALPRSELPATWAEIRAACDPKETFVDGWLREAGYTGADVGRGRKSAMARLSTNMRRVLSRCDELAALRDQLGDWRAELGS